MKTDWADMWHFTELPSPRRQPLDTNGGKLGNGALHHPDITTPNVQNVEVFSMVLQRNKEMLLVAFRCVICSLRHCSQPMYCLNY